MLTALIKLLDIAARSLFVLLSLYALPIRSTGQFGLALTLIGFFTFFSGFERYVDLQRRMVGHDAVECDRLIVSSWQFYATNYIACLPVLLALLVWWVSLPVDVALLCFVIAIGEHVSGEVYRIALIAPRYRAVLLTALAKNLALLLWAASEIWLSHDRFDIHRLTAAWAGLSLLFVLVAAIVFTRTWAFPSLASVCGAELTRIQQFRASRTHFMIGLVAVGLLQCDRVVVGSLLSLEDSGIYFRHILLASFAYQVFNVASYGRVAAHVYQHLHANRRHEARSIIRREMTMLVPASALVIAVFYFLASDHGPIPALRSVNADFLAVLTLGFLVRASADFNALLLNGAYSERDVFVAQFSTLCITVLLNSAMTQFFGLVGTVVTVALGSCVYLLISSLYTRNNPSLNGTLAT